MRISLLLAVSLTFLLAPPSLAQRATQAWYQVTTSRSEAQLIRAATVEVQTSPQGRSRILVDGRPLRMEGPVRLFPLGASETPPPQTQNSSGNYGYGNSNVDVGATITVDGNKVIQTLKITELDGRGRSTGKSTTITTTTTANEDGSTTTTTTTTTDDGSDGDSSTGDSSNGDRSGND